MNILNFADAFFSDSAHWQGYDGIPVRLFGASAASPSTSSTR